ncbi:MAG: iron-containing alcohol dehydrogenase [Alicyclobacillaceae bacterium]|nr:iron-containing alcohol dehydrogenase [Alicyclobacillaceae bacterium]MCY0896640.1 iron-containing alcohol dehydrogenase [Alicyclobacillaceae bacterium]
MNPFRFHNPTALYYGKGQLELELVNEVKHYGQRVLLLYGGGSIRRNGLYDKVVGLLQAGDIAVVELAGVEPNPRLTTVHRGIELCRTHSIDLILAVGGGSVLDCAKAIAMGVCFDGEVYDIYQRKAVATGALPIGTVLTLAATGSEMNSGGVITNWETKEKLGGGSPFTYPKFSFCDPENTFTVPKDQTVYGACDMLAHALEHYFHRTENAPLQRRMIESVLKTILETTPKVLANPEDYDARETMMYCSTMALNGMVSMGIQGDWANHAMEHEVSAIYDIPHGGGLAILFPHWMDYVVEEAPLRFADLARNVFGISEATSELSLARAGIAALRDFYASIGAPQRLAEYGIGSDQLDLMAEQSVRFGAIGNYRKLEKTDVLAILTAAL